MAAESLLIRGVASLAAGLASGRAGFAWTAGATYLLFLSRANDAWTIDGCGNSGPLDQSASVRAAIKSAQTAAADGLVKGMASTDSWTTGVPDVTIKAIGNGRTVESKTDRAGHFKIRLPAGRYRIAIRDGWSFEPEPFSYENPNDLSIAANGCSQVQFSGLRN
jgi:hypothetical protein